MLEEHGSVLVSTFQPWGLAGTMFSVRPDNLHGTHHYMSVRDIGTGKG